MVLQKDVETITHLSGGLIAQQMQKCKVSCSVHDDQRIFTSVYRNRKRSAQIAGQALSKVRKLLRSPPRERLLLTTASHACIARRRIMRERSIEVRKVAAARDHLANAAMATMPKSPMDGIEVMVRKRR